MLCSVYTFMFFNCDNITLYHNCLDCLSICWLNDNTQKYLTPRCYFERTARQMNSLTSSLETESTWTACLWVAILSCRITCKHVVFLLPRSHHEWRSADHATPPIVSIQRDVVTLCNFIILPFAQVTHRWSYLLILSLATLFKQSLSNCYCERNFKIENKKCADLRHQYGAIQVLRNAD